MNRPRKPYREPAEPGDVCPQCGSTGNDGFYLEWDPGTTSDNDPARLYCGVCGYGEDI